MRNRTTPTPWRCTWPVLLVILLVALALSSCDKLIPAVGWGGKVTLVTNLPSGHAAEQALRTTLTRKVTMVRPEPAFEIESVQGSQVHRLRHARNLVLMADLSKDDALTREVEKLVGERLLGEMLAGRRYHAFYSNVWALGQTLLVLAAPDSDTLAGAIEAGTDELYASFERRVVQRTAEIIFIAGEQESYSRYLRQTYGWSIRIPRGYRVSEDADTRVVRLYMPEGGVRLLFVHWQDGVRRLPDAETCFEIRSRIVWQYDQDVILAERSRSRRVDFRGGRALKLEGVWQNDRHQKGGPFRTYCFMKDDRFYMLDLLVFDPENPKINLMRQLEALALTFEHVSE